jgi:hypothetical protein
MYQRWGGSWKDRDSVKGQALSHCLALLGDLPFPLWDVRESRPPSPCFSSGLVLLHAMDQLHIPGIVSALIV